jgi:glycosyltransferase involved in cell wall biosynthesis
MDARFCEYTGNSFASDRKVEEARTVRATVIVPFHRNLVQLQNCLSAIRHSMPSVAIIVAADGARDDCGPVAAAHGARVLVVPGPSGPAVARNRGAAEATGDIFVFVDADVVVAADAIPRLCATLTDDTTLAAVFGAYDHAPAADNFMSQFKNLSHTYVHEIAHRRATTFWAGLGAVRADAFRAVGGFDERFTRPSVEDIDLGYRLTAAGRTIRLDPDVRGCHLKRWTLWSCVVTDLVARGIPWTQLIYRHHALANDLNMRYALRWSVVAALGTVVSAIVAFWTSWAWLGVALTLAALVALNFNYYRWFARERGPMFALRVLPAHFLHHVCNGVSLGVGTAVYLASRAGIALPGALPVVAWGVRRIGTDAAHRAASRP